MAKIPDRSAYILELSVQPGGSRWAEVHVYTKLEHIRAWVEEFCKNEAMSAYHAIWYGATLAIWVVQKGQVTQCIDLHDHITTSLRGNGPVPLADRDACLLLVQEARKTKPQPKDEYDADDENEEADEDDDEEEEEDWNDDDIDFLDEMKLECSWVEISAKLPPLEAPLVKPGQKIRIKHKKKPKLSTYVESGVHMYGSQDYEAGADLDPPFELDESDDAEEAEDADDDE